MVSLVDDAGTRAELWHRFAYIADSFHADKDRGASVNTSDLDDVHGLLTK